MLSKTDFQANSHNDDAHSITGVLKFQTLSLLVLVLLLLLGLAV